MCLAIPAKIKFIEGTAAKVDIMGVESEVNIQLVENLELGDYILVHAGCAIQKIDTEYFNNLQDIYETMFMEKKSDG